MRAVRNPPNPWRTTSVELLEPAPPAELQIWEEEAKSILARNESPDLSFRWSLNPYRGCFHGCAYCYARPSHQYLDWGAGTDFERRILVKTNTAELLRRRLSRKSWQGELIALSGNTDCYQPLEASYELTRACLEVCLEFHQPVAVITKGALVQRDTDVLARLAEVDCASVFVSIPFADNATGRAVEPYASTIDRRFETLRVLSEAGVPTGVAVAPIIPGLNDSDIPEILERAHAVGARRAFRMMVRLSAEVRPVFLERIEEAFPLRHKKIVSAIREVRGGRFNRTDFGARMRGTGPRWRAIETLFDTHARRLGFGSERVDEGRPSPFRRPTAQQSLF